MSELVLDSHKLVHHLPRVNRWLKGEHVAPVYAHIEPVGHNGDWCLYCTGTHLAKDGCFLPGNLFSGLVSDLSDAGISAVQFAGKGEPLLHPDLPARIETLSARGIAIAVDTFGAAFDEALLARVLPRLAWLRLTAYAGTPELYARLYKTPPAAFTGILDRMELAARMCREKGWPAVVGAHGIVSRENLPTLLPLARELKRRGLRYLQLKPLFLKNAQGRWEYLSPPESLETLKEVEAVGDDAFSVSIRWEGFGPFKGRAYDHCRALPFFVEATCRGEIYTCGPWVGDKTFRCGDLNQSRFSEIWKGEEKARAFRHAGTTLDVRTCMPYCRPDPSNTFLHQLLSPPAHVNFI